MHTWPSTYAHLISSQTSGSSRVWATPCHHYHNQEEVYTLRIAFKYTYWKSNCSISLKKKKQQKKPKRVSLTFTNLLNLQVSSLMLVEQQHSIISIFPNFRVMRWLFHIQSPIPKKLNFPPNLQLNLHKIAIKLPFPTHCPDLC